MLFRVLGPVEVQIDGDVVAISAEKPRRLLSMLLLHADAWVSVDTLVGELWPAGPPASATANIKTYISQLRQLLAPTGDVDHIDRRANAYRLTVARGEVDVTIFEESVSAGEAALGAGDPKTAVERLSEALALWRGKPYESLETDQATSAAARLTEIRWTAQDTLAAALTAVDRTGDAIAVLRGLLAENPLREPTWKLLMTALHAAGRRADALAAYQQARQTLVEALGVEPGADLQRLHRQLLHDDPPIEPAQAPAPSRAQAPSPIQASASAPAEPAHIVPRHRRRRLLAMLALLGAALLGVVATMFVVTSDDTRGLAPVDPGVSPVPGSAAPGPTGTSSRRSVPGFATRQDEAKVLFGIGDQANSAMASDLVRLTPAHMLTTWVHKPDDLDRLRAWRADLVPQAYRDGNALHLIVTDWDRDDPAKAMTTTYGTGCGQPLPLSNGFLDEARSLAAIFAGRADDPPLYVTVFHGVNIFGCKDGSYDEDPATAIYLRALKDRYVQVREIFRDGAPNARVALGWQGWQAETDDPSVGGGRSMFKHFADVMQTSDFQSVVSWEPDDNVALIRNMVRTLGRYGPVLVEYGGNPDALKIFDRDMRGLLSDESLTNLVGDGLFAWNFSDSNLLNSSPATYDLIKATVRRRGGPAH